MEQIQHNSTTYGFARDFKQDQNIRSSFNSLTESVFGFSLENWYQDGFWGDYYIPYALLHNEQVVSNVSMNKIAFDLEGKRATGIQIGTVMTDQAYRNRGLSTYLLERVLQEWKDQADFIYLFANKTVLDFYPKFGFELVEEYQYSKKITANSRSSSWTKLNMEDVSDVALFLEKIKESIPLAKISMRDNTSLIMFYCNSFKKDCIYYNKKLDVIVIAHATGDSLYLDDMFSQNPIELNHIIQSIADEKLERVVLGFTPLDDSGFEKQLLKGEDTLFMLKERRTSFSDIEGMFPVLSHA